MKKYLILFLLTGCLLYACNKSTQRTNEITKIEIATGGCFGPCQSTIVSIDSSLQYRYFGGETYFSLPREERNKNLKGYFVGKISQGFWDTLNVSLEKINYKQLDSTYQHSVDDQSLVILIDYNGKKKLIRAQSASLPDSVQEAFYSIIKSYSVVRLKPTRDTLHFEINSLSEPPKPDVKGVKFMPPN